MLVYVATAIIFLGLCQKSTQLVAEFDRRNLLSNGIGFRRRNYVIQSCETYCPDPNYPRASTLVKSSNSGPLLYPPLIHHIQNEIDFPTLTSLIAFETGLPLSYIEELITFGAVYVSLSKTNSKFGVSAAKTSMGRMVVSGKRAATGGSSEPASNDKKLIKRVLIANIAVPAGSYCRVHVNPRRCFEAISNVDWKERILSHPDQLVASTLFVDKVAGVPVSSTIDNYYENMMSQVQQILPRNSPPLHLGSRLDVCTSGEVICELSSSVRCTYELALTFPSRLTTANYLTNMRVIPLAKNKAAATILSKAIADKAIGKVYLALCRRRIPLGIQQHCFRRKSKSHDNAKPTLLRAYDASLLELKEALRTDDWKESINKRARDKGSERTNENQLGSRMRGERGNIVPQQGRGSQLPTEKYPDSSTDILSTTYQGSRSGIQLGSIWQLAELEVLSCKKLDRDDLSSEGAMHLHNAERSLSESADMRVDNDIDEDMSELFQCEIRLVTGRTHQIRLQLAAMGASIVGDTRYEPVEGLLDSSDDAHSTEDIGDRVDVTSPLKSSVGDGSHLMGPEPKRIGLQCAKLYFPKDIAVNLSLVDAESSNLLHIRRNENALNDIVPPAMQQDGGVLVSAGVPWWLR